MSTTDPPIEPACSPVETDLDHGKDDVPELHQAFR
jgi:hypothetical protein